MVAHVCSFSPNYRSCTFFLIVFHLPNLLWLLHSGAYTEWGESLGLAPRVLECLWAQRGDPPVRYNFKGSTQRSCGQLPAKVLIHQEPCPFNVLWYSYLPLSWFPSLSHSQRSCISTGYCWRKMGFSRLIPYNWDRWALSTLCLPQGRAHSPRGGEGQCRENSFYYLHCDQTLFFFFPPMMCWNLPLGRLDFCKSFSSEGICPG